MMVVFHDHLSCDNLSQDSALLQLYVCSPVLGIETTSLYCLHPIEEERWM